MFGSIFRRHIDLSALELTILSAPGCHLCEEAVAAVEALQKKYPFQYKVVKLTRRHELFDTYREKIPVGLIGDHIVFLYRVDPDQLLTTLQTHARQIT